LRARIAGLVPALAASVSELGDWDQIKQLTVQVNRLDRWWRPGLLCIGDAAHAMSPIGGIGINLAIQDAVAAANILAPVFARGAPSNEDLQRVQKRREFPTRATQSLQMAIQNNVMTRVLGSTVDPRPPFAVKLLNAFPYLRRFPAWLLGIGFRPEHVHTPEMAAAPYRR